MPERQSHNSRRRHSSPQCLVSNRPYVHRGAGQGFDEAVEEGAEGMAGALPQFLRVRTEKRCVIRGAFLGWIACGGLGGRGVPCGSRHFTPTDHAAL